jgi:penicillin-binding protein 2
MIEPLEMKGRGPSQAKVARRMTIISGVAFGIVAILLLRLWYLQVLSGDDYLAKANDNQIRDVAIAAPRGRIVDRNGKVLVDSRPAAAIVVMPGRLPKAGSPERYEVSVRLSQALALPTQKRPCRLAGSTPELTPLGCTIEREAAAMPYANVIVRSDASRDESAWVLEHQRELPGADVTRIWLRSYPQGNVGAQLFGTVGEITAEQLGKPRFTGIPQGTVIGQSGLEYEYDRYLRGHDGAERIQVDAQGRARHTLRNTPSLPGRTLRLSIDANLLKEGQSALAQGIGLGAGNGANAAAYVAIDPRNGDVLAMGSAPSFDPNIFTKPIPNDRYRQLFGAGSSYPQLNRAIQSAYPTGSTFKPVTALAALTSHTIVPSTTIDDPGSIKIGNIVFHNAGNAANGPVDLISALRVSSDVYFYRLGARLNQTNPTGGPIQSWADRLGFGRPTGIDLPGEIGGTVPSPQWRAGRNSLEARCTKKKGHRCGISDGRPWSVGDNVNFSVGQGDFLATPLQLGAAYAAIANGGSLFTPQIGLDVRNSKGLVLQALRPAPPRPVGIPAHDRSAILEGLRQAAMEPGGTSADVFSGFGHTVYGKTGTAQRLGQSDQSWYVAYFPDSTHPVVIAATVENGGFGAAAAAPLVRLIASQWLGVKKQLVTGTSTTR